MRIRSCSDLRTLVESGLRWILSQPGVEAAEVFAAAQDLLLARLNYTSHIPCHGVEEPKSVEVGGVSVQVRFRGETDEPRIGFGSQSGLLDLEGIQRAFEKARLAAVEDPWFRDFPPPQGSPGIEPVLDPLLMKEADAILVQAGWEALEGALEVFEEAGPPRGMIVGGDVTLLRERMAVANSQGLQVAEEATSAHAAITAMVEEQEAKGTGWSVGVSLEGPHAFSARSAGQEAARATLASREGVVLPSGEYPVILGPQAVADLLDNVVLPSLMLSVLDANASTFQGALGEEVWDPRLSLWDHGALPGGAASRQYTCEGIPTGRTSLIQGGRLVGFLGNHYYWRKFQEDSEGPGKLGGTQERARTSLSARNGFRSGEALGRNPQVRPGIVPTNVGLEGEGASDEAVLLEDLGRGIYIGRIWYTYPVNGLRAGDFTATVVGDSFVVEEGRRSTPLRPNSLRLHGNIHQVFRKIRGIGRTPQTVVLWGSPSVLRVPALLVEALFLEAIGGPQ